MDGVRERTLVGLFVLVAGGLVLGAIAVISGGLGGATVSHRALQISDDLLTDC